MERVELEALIPPPFVVDGRNIRCPYCGEMIDCYADDGEERHFCKRMENRQYQNTLDGLIAFNTYRHWSQQFRRVYEPTMDMFHMSNWRNAFFGIVRQCMVTNVRSVSEYIKYIGTGTIQPPQASHFRVVDEYRVRVMWYTPLSEELVSSMSQLATICDQNELGVAEVLNQLSISEMVTMVRAQVIHPLMVIKVPHLTQLVRSMTVHQKANFFYATNVFGYNGELKEDPESQAILDGFMALFN